jgi:hypothetical protein
MTNSQQINQWIENEEKFLNQLLSEQTDLSEEHFSKFQLYVKTKVEGMKFLRDLIETNLDISI